MRNTCLVILIVLVALALSGCRPKMVTVSSGEKVICSQCDKVIRSDIQTQQVPEIEVVNFSVREIREKCSQCLAKEAEQKKIIEAREAVRRREELARQRRVELENQRSRIVGSWVYHWTMTDVILRMNADGTGTFNNEPLKWQVVSDGFKGSFVTQLGWDQKPFTFYFTGRVTPTGRLEFHFLNHHWDWLLGPDLVFEPL